MVQINKKSAPDDTFPLFNLGFRPFFFGASIFAFFSIISWIFVYFSKISISTAPLSIFQWHSHEMIFGYSTAVIAGFLLTAIMNWTGVQTLRGVALALLFICWMAARISFLLGSGFYAFTAITDLLFMLSLFFSAAKPIFLSKQWKKVAILSKLFLLFLTNLCFYLGVFGVLDRGIHWGIYGGLYLVISFILTIGGMVIPGFIRNGVGYDVQISNPKWLSLSSMALFLLFFINQLFLENQFALGVLASALFILNSLRLVFWHTKGIWKKPLLWSLYLSFVFIDLGFLLCAISSVSPISLFLAVHAFAYGGIGLATMGMMARVILGHTGRDVRSPPPFTAYTFMTLTIGAIVRIGFTLFDQNNYTYWIFISQLLWVAAFILFLFIYAKMLFQPRTDGLPG